MEDSKISKQRLVALVPWGHMPWVVLLHSLHTSLPPFSFLDCLKKEDQNLYPVLNNAAKSDTSLKKNIGGFAKDKDEISNNWMAFFMEQIEKNFDLSQFFFYGYTV